MELDGKIIWFPEYVYKGITGNHYTPHFKDGMWYVVPNSPIAFLYFVYLCGVPEDEALMLKLKFGGSNDLHSRRDCI